MKGVFCSFTIRREVLPATGVALPVRTVRVHCKTIDRRRKQGGQKKMEKGENNMIVVPEEPARPAISTSGEGDQGLHAASASKPSLSRLMVIALAVTCGVAVANIY